MKNILLTGGLGYIGSHVAVELASRHYNMIILDDLSNSDIDVLSRLKKLTGTDIKFVQGDIRDDNLLRSIFDDYKIEGIIHFAAKKAVGESVNKPLLYYDVNVAGLTALLKIVEEKGARKLIFSSSCTVYGKPEQLPVTENTPFGFTPSPYGKTKQMCEYILEDYARVHDSSIVSLRYFNPVGAHESAEIGELPKGVPNNLVPFITQAAAKKRDQLSVFGGDYGTPDGSAIRDYIHVVDLAKAHVKALEVETGKYDNFNIGTGKGYSVLEVIKTFEEVNGVKVPYKMADRRAGDLEIIYGDPAKANNILGWKAQLHLSEMMKSAWEWEKMLK